MTETLRDGRFVVVGRLGRGSQGETFDAVDKREGRAVAIKRFDVGGAQSWKDVPMFVRAGSILATHTAAATGAGERAAFVSGLNELLLISGALAIVGVLCSLVLIRREDFVVHLPEPEAGAAGESAPRESEPAAV